MSVPPVMTLLAYETALHDRGFKLVAGFDEAGRGPLAGPVVTAGVIFAPGVVIEGVYDSKKLSARRREYLYSLICEKALAWAVNVTDNTVIDRVNILEATRLSMSLSCNDLSVSPEFILTDAVVFPSSIPLEPIVKGDQKSFTVAAASILAKVTRDRIMDRLHAEHPQYGWDTNRGYPTRFHRRAVMLHGFTPYHRRSFTVRPAE